MTALSAHTTLGVGGPAATFVAAHTEDEFISTVRNADDAGIPVLVLGGGSNMVVADSGFAGVVVTDSRRDVTVSDDPQCGGASITVSAGHEWDALVARAVAEGWSSLEALSGIPGTVGATPIQNVGAYGQDVSAVIASVRTWDRHTAQVRTFARADCAFGYRTSVFKRSMHPADVTDTPWHPSPRFVVLEVTFQLPYGDLSSPVQYAQLAERLGVAIGTRAPSVDVRAAVRELRAEKGMVLDAADPDTASVGSFFTNPLVAIEAAEALPEDAPRFPISDDSARVKLSAAWLIEYAGIAKGFALPGSRAGVSTKHALALTNRGDATAAEVIALAQHVRDTVREHTDVSLVPEPVLVNLSLDP